jgi:hypothetical protein
MSHEFDIRRSVVLPATPEQVWQAVATAAGQAAWYMTAPDWPEPAEMADVCDPPARLRIPIGDTQLLEFLIEADAGGTAVLRLMHSGVLDTEGQEDGWGDEFDAMTQAGWAMYLQTLQSYLRFFAGRPAGYAEAEAPGPGGWTAVVDALGRTLGAEVELTVAGTRLQGEIDYVAERFLGLRTPGALIRFHERSAIGMPVAVSHHDYTGADPVELSSAWRTWLTERIHS